MSVVCKHNSGFFSCCSVRLYDICCYINNAHQYPEKVNSSSQFLYYKNREHVLQNTDITNVYFEDYNNIPSPPISSYPIQCGIDDQFINYSNVEYKNIIPIVIKYFTPSQNIKNRVSYLEKKYALDYNNTCVLFYRGNDKNTETTICGYDEYLYFAHSILETNPTIQFLLQSDETEFIEFMTAAFPNNSFYFRDEIRHMKKCNSTVDIQMRSQNFEYSQYYLAITIVMSKCKYIVCGSGNCSIWIIYYRGNNKNVFQNLNGKWYDDQKEYPPLPSSHQSRLPPPPTPRKIPRINMQRIFM